MRNFRAAHRGRRKACGNMLVRTAIQTWRTAGYYGVLAARANALEFAFQQPRLEATALAQKHCQAVE
jgi:hypothetical protein